MDLNPCILDFICSKIYSMSLSSFACIDVNNKTQSDEDEREQKELHISAQNCLATSFFLTMQGIFLGSLKSMTLSSTGSHFIKGKQSMHACTQTCTSVRFIVIKGQNKCFHVFLSFLVFECVQYCWPKQHLKDLQFGGKTSSLFPSVPAQSQLNFYLYAK